MLSSIQITNTIDKLLRYRCKASDGIRDVMTIKNPYTGPVRLDNIVNSVGIKISGDQYEVDGVKYIYISIPKLTKKHNILITEMCISTGAEVVMIDGYINKPHISQSHVEKTNAMIISLISIYPALMAMNNKMTFNYIRYTKCPYTHMDKININTLLSTDVICTILGLKAGMYLEYDSIESISGSIAIVKRIRRITKLSTIENVDYTNDEINVEDDINLGEDNEAMDDSLSVVYDDEDFSDEAD